MTAWYERSFGKDYLNVYKHRDLECAMSEVRKMIGWLDLPAGASVFDLCCGMGRHSLALAEAGYRVTGMDLSEAMLQEAALHDTEQKVRWVRGDMRDVPLDETFDAVVNLFTSFGYFEDERENTRVLHEIDRLLDDGGRFIIDFLNAAYIERHLVPFTRREDGNLLIEESRSIEGGSVRKLIVVREEGMAERRYMEQVRLYSLSDFQRMLDATSLRIDSMYGTPDGTPYSKADSKRLIMVGTKKAGASHGG
ncbi:class I SAM-dependent methyltransferase [Paenibacillus sp. MBLB4367]|uniref:class I SAM-dependent methyltransferase n=1 Tax=Paenibacillus sp. MBLB4367 TaxID=3384767 RepID=UPI003907F02C